MTAEGLLILRSSFLVQIHEYLVVAGSENNFGRFSYGIVKTLFNIKISNSPVANDREKMIGASSISHYLKFTGISNP